MRVGESVWALCKCIMPVALVAGLDSFPAGRESSDFLRSLPEKYLVLLFS